MSELDKELLKLYQILEQIIKEQKEDMEVGKKDEPIMIPTEIYDDMCDELGTDEIGLMGIS